VVTENGKKMPLDPVPPGDGTGRLRKERLLPNGDKLVHFVKDSELEANTSPLYTSHFQTCVDAKDWKK
jgi:hypothetical protein